MTRWELSCVFGIMFAMVSCNSSPRIEGAVKDYWGKPMPDVNVSIATTAYHAITNSSGHYSIEYVPGNITLEFEKPGYEEQKLSLNIATASTFPAADISLLPVPPRGVAFLGSVGLEDIVPVPISHRTFSQRGRDPMGIATENHDVATLEGASTVLHVSDKLQIVETVSPNLRLVRLGSGGTIIDIWRSPLTVGNEGRFDLQREDVQSRSRVRLHTATLLPGRYAYVDIAPQTLFQGMHITSQTAYPFTIQ